MVTFALKVGDKGEDTKGLLTLKEEFQAHGLTGKVIRDDGNNQLYTGKK